MVLKADISNAFEPLVPCGDTPEGTAYYRLEARALGTVCTITFGAPHRRVACQYREQAGSWLAGFEKRYSRFRSDSLISQINQLAAHEPVGVDGELEGLFRLCDWYHWSSQGLFDPTMMPLNELWGFGTDGSQPRGAPTPQAVAQARALVSKLFSLWIHCGGRPAECGQVNADQYHSWQQGQHRDAKAPDYPASNTWR